MGKAIEIFLRGFLNLVICIFSYVLCFKQFFFTDGISVGGIIISLVWLWVSFLASNYTLSGITMIISHINIARLNKEILTREEYSKRRATYEHVYLDELEEHEHTDIVIKANRNISFIIIVIFVTINVLRL